MLFRSAWRYIKEFYSKRWFSSLVIIFSILVILMFLEIKNHRFRSNDFLVYHRAAERLIHGENLYQPDVDGHYYYKYSPTAAIYFIPSAIFPDTPAKVLHWIVMAFVTCLGFYLALIMVKPRFREDNPRIINNLILLIGLILGVHLEYEFFLGQVNQILMVLFFLIIFLANRNKDIPAALIWAGTIFIKPFGFIFLPYFLIKRRFKLSFLFILFTALLILAPLPFIGTANFAGQYQHWFHELSVEMNAKQSLLAPANDTIFSILARYTPLRLLDFTPGAVFILQSVVTGLIAILFLYFFALGRSLKDNYIWEGAFLIALIPLLSSTNYYAFQFIELAVFLIVFNFHKLAKWWKVVAIAGFILTGINMHDLWGSTIWHFFINISLVAVGACLIQTVLVYLRLRDIA
jgi:hypothetical protein